MSTTELKAILDSGNMEALIDATSGSRYSDVWALAITAHYGPTGLHQSWTNADGTPSAECLAKLPDVVRAIESARERLAYRIDWWARYDRDFQ